MVNDENKLLSFERKKLRKIYEPTRNAITGEYERKKRRPGAII